MSETEITRKLKNSARKNKLARDRAETAWEAHKADIIDAYATGEISLQAVADSIGVTKARVWQIVNGYKPPRND